MNILICVRSLKFFILFVFIAQQTPSCRWQALHATLAVWHLLMLISNGNITALTGIGTTWSAKWLRWLRWLWTTSTNVFKPRLLRYIILNLISWGREGLSTAMWVIMRMIIPPASTKLKGGYTGFTLSVCPSMDRIVSALYFQQYWSDPFHVCTSYQATSEGVSCVTFVSKLKNLKFWRIL